MNKKNLLFIIIGGLLLFVLLKIMYCVIDQQSIILIIQTIILGITGLIVYKYTFEMSEQTKLSRKNMTLNTLIKLTDYYNQFGDVRGKLFRNEKMKLSDCTRLCNFLDEVGHIVYELPKEDQEIAVAQWNENIIRCWIKLKNFVVKKRDFSIGRDYAYFEWLANKSWEDYKQKFSDKFKMHFYKFGDEEINPTKDEIKFEYFETDLLVKYREIFSSSLNIEKEFIKPN
jgi:hypothetical protein